MAKKKKIRDKKFPQQHTGNATVRPPASLTSRLKDSRLTRPVAATPATPATVTTYYLELADIALGGKTEPGDKKGGT